MDGRAWCVGYVCAAGKIKCAERLSTSRKCNSFTTTFSFSRPHSSETPIKRASGAHRRSKRFYGNGGGLSGPRETGIRLMCWLCGRPRDCSLETLGLMGNSPRVECAYDWISGVKERSNRANGEIRTQATPQRSFTQRFVSLSDRCCISVMVCSTPVDGRERPQSGASTVLGKHIGPPFSMTSGLS